jgi:hypothetical protein
MLIGRNGSFLLCGRHSAKMADQDEAIEGKTAADLGVFSSERHAYEHEFIARQVTCSPLIRQPIPGPL